MEDDLGRIKHDWKIVFLLKFLIIQPLFCIINIKTPTFLNIALQLYFIMSFDWGLQTILNKHIDKEPKSI